MRGGLVPALVLVVLGALVVGLIGYVSESDGSMSLVLSEVSGEVTVSGEDAPAVEAAAGRRLDPLDRVRTGQGSRAVLQMGQETRIRLGPTSSVQVKAVDEEGVEIELEDGALQATVRPDSGSVRLSSRGREALLTDADVRMGVGPQGMLLLEATRGDVMLGGVVGASLLEEGGRLTVGDHAQIGPIPSDLLLSVRWPDDPRTGREEVHLTGTTEPGARVLLTGSAGVVEVRADGSGAFSAVVPLFEGENPVRVEAVDLLGNRVQVRGVLERDESGPTFRGGVEYQ